jgi:hypothetical protein
VDGLCTAAMLTHSVFEILCCSCRAVCNTSNFFARAHSEPCETELCALMVVHRKVETERITCVQTSALTIVGGYGVPTA